MDGFSIIVFAIAVAIFIGWAELLIHFAGKEKKWIFGLIYMIGIITPLVSVYILMNSTNFASIIMGILSLLFLVFVGATLYEQGGKKERRWFYLTIIFPILALVYQFTNR